jgi:sialate O-acetylesterase
MSFNKNLFNLILSIFFLLLFASCQKQDTIPLSLSPLFGNHAVLQQNDNVAFWGKYTPNQTIKIEGSWGSSASTASNKNGSWKLQLSTPKAGGPYTVTISTSDSTIVLEDILIGEVWLASGQSNMEMTLSGYMPNEPIDNWEAEIAAADYPNIRFFDVARKASQVPVTDYNGEWKITSPETAKDFSATGYFFARKLHQELNIPIGIIGSNWGGTPVEAWTSKEKIKSLDEFSDEITAMENFDPTTISDYLSQFKASLEPTKMKGWEDLELEDIQFSKTDFDDSNWEKANLPGFVEDFSPTGSDGAFWFRKTIDISDINTNYTLHIEDGVDDADHTYINGQKVGFMFCWNCPRAYKIDKSVLVEGKNSIAIRMLDTYGAGGFKGKMYLKSDNGEVISLEGKWSYFHTADFFIYDGKRQFFLTHLNPEASKDKPKGFEVFNKIEGANAPTVLYNGMIHPIVPYSIKGAIWYQGESNVGRAIQYGRLFPGMIEDWRARWGKDFPFYFVQIAPYNYSNDLSPKLRDAQRHSLHVAKTGMAVTLDIGHPTNIHPGNKQDVGDRLARLALANDYGKNLVSSGPLYKSQETKENTIIISFDHIGGGLVAKDGKLTGFEIAPKSQNFVPAAAKIVGNTVVVSAKSVEAPLYVRYAFKDVSTASLFNKEGLPASSFESSY